LDYYATDNKNSKSNSDKGHELSVAHTQSRKVHCNVGNDAPLADATWTIEHQQQGRFLFNYYNYSL